MKMFLKTMVTQLIEDDRTEITRNWTGPGQISIAIVEQTWPDIEKDIAEFDVKQLHATSQAPPPPPDTPPPPQWSHRQLQEVSHHKVKQVIDDFMAPVRTLKQVGIGQFVGWVLKLAQQLYKFDQRRQVDEAYAAAWRQLTNKI
jgi:hypothetical protein